MARISLVALALALVAVALKPSEARSWRSAEEKTKPIYNTRLPLYSQVKDSGLAPDYWIHIYIGTPPQRLRVKIDTTGYDFWVLSSRCTKGAFKYYNKYTSIKSSSYKKDGRKSGSRSSGMSGFLSIDTVHIGNVALPNVTFGEATDPGPGFEDHIYDGVMGINFLQPEEGEADSVMSKLARSELVYWPKVFFHIFDEYIDAGQIGEVGFGELGATDSYGWEGGVQTGREGYNVKFEGVYVGNTTICADCDVAVIGSSDRLIVPYKEAVELNKAIGATEDPNPAGLPDHYWTFDDCDHEGHPVVFVDVGGVRLYIEPKYYMVELPSGKCRSIFTGQEKKNFWIINFEFMRAILVAFDHKDKFVFFGQKLPIPTIA